MPSSPHDEAAVAAALPLIGQSIVLDAATVDDSVAITSLRNRDGIRRWFTDSRILDFDESRKWLVRLDGVGSKMLVIRAHDGTFLGFLGWSAYRGTSVELGRIAVDTAAWRRLARRLGHVPPVTDEASRLLIDHAFGVLGVAQVITRVMPHNRTSSDLCARMGLVRGDLVRDPCGVDLVMFSIARDAWARDRQMCR